MHFDIHVGFAIATGVIMFVTAALPVPKNERVGAIIGGLVCMGYGIYIATLGPGERFRFPLYLYAFPFLGVAKVAGAMLSERARGAAVQPVESLTPWYAADVPAGSARTAFRAGT